MKQLERAILLAVQAHAAAGQEEKAGAPYIVHPLRVMLRMATEADMMAAILHDVVEDTGWTLEGLWREGFPEEVVEAVDCLTRREGEPYDHFIGRVSRNEIARRVKLADLEDNLDVKRMRALSEEDTHRPNRYLSHWNVLRRA